MGFTILQDKVVHTRKEHQCYGCLRKFPKGTSMRYIFSVHNNHYDGGSMYLCDFCDACLEDADHYYVDDGLPPGFYWDMLPEFEKDWYGPQEE